MNDALPWYKSPVMISQVVAAVSAFAEVAPKIATTMGLTSADAINQTVTGAFGVIALGAAIYGGIKRAQSRLEPLTLTQSGADQHPQTLANAASSQKNDEPPRNP